MYAHNLGIIMNYKTLLVLYVLFISLASHSMYRLAQETDIPALLTLIQTKAVQDQDKIVILPEQFREHALQHEIANNRLFVAEHGSEIVGYKKLFLIEDDREKRAIMFDELRMNKPAVYIGTIDQDSNFAETDVFFPVETYDLCLYNGADFTAPEQRGKGINSGLTAFALHSLQPAVSAFIQEKNPTSIHMLYGITQDNAGEKPGQYPDRTVKISQQFRTFIGSMLNMAPEKPFIHMRHKAAKPSFDLEDLTAQEPQPLPDEDSIPGFGCILSYYLGDS